MKTQYFLIKVILILSINLINSQEINGIVTYSTYRNKNNIKNIEPIKNLTLFDEKIKKEIKQLRLSLVFSRNKSSFTCIEPMHKDQAEKRVHFIAKILQKVYPSYYTNKTQYIEEKDLGGEVFLIKNKIDINDWTLVNEKKKIGRYTCYKATRDYSFINSKGNKKTNKQIVWYTLEIPIHFGPKNFVGFPGLVLKVEDGSLVYEAIKIILNHKEGVELKKPPKGKEISQEEYDKIQEESSITIRREMKKRKNEK